MVDHGVRPARDVDEIVALAERHEPGSTRLIGEVVRWGLTPTNRAFVVDGGGAPAGVAVITRRCRDRWHATVVLEGPDAAPALAAVLDDSPARTVVGLTPHVAPLVSHLRRVQRVDAGPFHGSEIAVEELAPPDPRIREATTADLDALVELYASFEQQDIPTKPRLRGFLQDALTTLPILVAEVDGRVIGAVRCDWASRTTDFWWAQSVAPEHRGSGLGNTFLFAAMSHSGRRGRRVCGIIGPSNPVRAMGSAAWEPFMHLKDHHQQAEWMTARLGPRHNSLVHRAGRRALETLEGRTRSR